MTLADIQSDFALLDDWEDRYRYVIELGRKLPALPDELRTDANKVRGCASQVWLATSEAGGAMTMQGASDAMIVQGLIAILFAIYAGKSPADVASLDAARIFDGLGLKEHLTPQRSNGLVAMVERIRTDARALESGAHAAASSAR
ncbi:MAG: SufE family protein [Hyphomicrobium sp.]